MTKTRVLKAWRDTDWVYWVERWWVPEEDTPLFGNGLQQVDTAKAGEGRWQFVQGNMTKEHALVVADSVSKGGKCGDEEVVAEFGGDEDERRMEAIAKVMRGEEQ